MEIFRQRLQMLLDEKNINQKELAELSGVTEVTISRYMNGFRKPRIEIANKIAQVLNTTTDYLLGNSDIRNPYEGSQFNQTDKFITDLKKRAKERNIEFDEESVEDLLDLYEFLRNRDKNSNWHRYLVAIFVLIIKVFIY